MRNRKDDELSLASGIFIFFLLILASPIIGIMIVIDIIRDFKKND